MRNYFNDSPIETAEDDRYGITPFAESIAKSILSIQQPIGTTIALHGPWGSGKSSAVNLIRTALEEAKESNLVITDFKCWWYRGEEALALAFLQNLDSVLRSSLGDKVKNLIPNITRRLLQAGPVVGTIVSLASGNAWAALIPGMSKFANTFFPEGATVERTFRKLAKVLEGQDRRFLVIIDDIDRLTPEEALAIFRLLKSVGRLPNVMYLVVFDRDLAERTVEEKYSSEGPHFLEKIIQAGFELPAPVQTDLNDAVLASISEICGEPNEAQIVRMMNVFYDVVVPYITTPRHVARFQNAISVTWPAIASEINLADFVALETLRLYEPGPFKAIRLHKDHVCGTQQQQDANQQDNTRFDTFLREVPESRHELARLALQRLFPRLENMGYGGEWITEWSSERRVCVETHFDTYFRLSLSDEALSSKQVDELILRANDRQFIQKALRGAARVERKGGKSMVPIYLDELTTHARQVPKGSVELLMSALFEIHDEIDLEKDADRGFMGMANTSLRFHWLIRRLTRERFSIDERTALYLAGTESAALGWLVDFVASARADYRERPDRPPPQREEDCLVTEQALESLTTRALEAIRAAAADGSLLRHQDLLYILYRWRDFLGNDPTEIRAWTDALIKDDTSLVVLARSMTGRSWSMGMGGFGSLGDRVSRASTTAQISDDTDIVDVEAFRAGLNRILQEGRLERGSLEAVGRFLDAWDRKRRGDDD
jgi:predicted KAP-like P-loop ATPase